MTVVEMPDRAGITTVGSFSFAPQAIPEVVLIESRAFPDDRGFFVEWHKRSAFAAGGIDEGFVQDNASRSKPAVLRGLHYQVPPRPLGKLVGVPRGRIFDVAVDIRTGSPTFGGWVGTELSSENHRMLWVPEGFAHGFVALEESDVVYKMTGEYSPQHERGIVWNDPEIGIAWPVAEPVLSQKDAALPSLRDAEVFTDDPAPPA